tara:strand:+ start:234 stop:719 length:486 start_codon:yes stop_codon:yes gene_type:complete
MTYVFESVFKKPKFAVTSHSSSQITSNTLGTPMVISGSEITYEPDASASKVIYEISFYAEKINGNLFQAIYLQEHNGSSWVEINQRNRKNFGVGGSDTNQSHRYYQHFRFILPTWSGSKQLRLITVPENHNLPVTFHQMSEWNGGSSSTTFCNTTLLVYSI